MKLLVFGLSLTSSWGNGHATTYRALLRAFAERGHTITFYERDAPWYGGENRDLPSPPFANLVLYPEWSAVRGDALREAERADAVIVGSYVRDGPTIIDDLLAEGAPLFFYDIDTPVTFAGLRAGTVDYLRKEQIPEFERYLSFTGGPFLDTVVVGEFRARAADALYCSVDVDAYRRLEEPDPEFDVELAYMGTYAPDRQPVVERLLLEVARRLPDRRFIVAGPQYPGGTDWPSNVRHISHLPPSKHAAFYSAARWQLNATRADMVAAGWSPSVRLFEAGASGAAVMSDYWPGIDELFAPGREILLPETTEAVVEILTTTDARSRRGIGEAFRARILEDHSSRRRAAELEGLLVPNASEPTSGATGPGAGNAQPGAAPLTDTPQRT